MLICASNYQWLVLLPSLILAGPSSSAAGVRSMADVLHARQEGFWRLPENDGLNCLYLQLRLMGYPKPYESYLQEIGHRAVPHDLASLKATAGRLGFSLVPSRLTMTEVDSVPVPVIAHLERGERGSGYFGLIIDTNEREVVVFHGGMASIEVLPRDNFRREWSGFALVPGEQSEWSSKVRRLLAALMVAWAVVSVTRTIRRK